MSTYYYNSPEQAMMINNSTALATITTDSTANIVGDYNSQTIGISQPNIGTYGGYRCSCGAWVYPYQVHQCYPYAVPVQIPTVIVTTPIVTVDPEVAKLREEVRRLREEMAALCDVLETLTDLLHNGQDAEEVRGHSEDGCDPIDSEPGSETPSLREPKGDWYWPPRD